LTGPSPLFREAREDSENLPSTTTGGPPAHAVAFERTSWSGALTSYNFTIFEGASEIQRMLIGRAVTGLDVQ
jgi:hypothetical protein